VISDALVRTNQAADRDLQLLTTGPYTDIAVEIRAIIDAMRVPMISSDLTCGEYGAAYQLAKMQRDDAAKERRQ
jgi:hypothetical protein